MSWVKLDDRFHENNKQLCMSDKAFRLYVCALSYCARDTEPTGYLADVQARGLARSLRIPTKAIDELVALNAWELATDGYLIHDYHEYTEKGSRERVRQWREGKKLAGITEAEFIALRQQVYARDGYRCRYCGAQPERRWLVADHVIPTPTGPTTLDNLVSACRSCNKRKGGRTPEEAGMKVLPLSYGEVTVTPLARDGYPVPKPVPGDLSPKVTSGRQSPREETADGLTTEEPDVQAYVERWMKHAGQPSALDLEFFRRVPYECDRLARQAILEEIERLADRFLGKSKPMPPASYLGGRLADLQSAASDSGVRPQTRSRSGMTRIGEVLGNV